MQKAFSKSRILIADDQEANIRVLEGMLFRAGYRSVRSTTRPEEVIPLFREYRPDLLLLDLHMPSWEAIEIMQELHASVPESASVPVLVLTADTDQSSRNAALRYGARDFLSKPFDLNEVLLRIQNLLDLRHVYQELDRLRGAEGRAGKAEG